jgi:hypothetical protein
MILPCNSFSELTRVRGNPVRFLDQCVLVGLKLAGGCVQVLDVLLKSGQSFAPEQYLGARDRWIPVVVGGRRIASAQPEPAASTPELPYRNAVSTTA